MATTPTPTSPPKRRWLRRLAVCLVAAAVLLVGAYFVVTSNAFLQAVVLPRVGAALKGKVTASRIELHPFSSLVVRDLQLHLEAAEPALTLAEFRVRYRLSQLLGGAITLEELLLDRPLLQVTVFTNGTTSLDPLLAAPTATAKPTPAASPAAAPLQVDLRAVRLQDATVRLVRHLPGSASQRVELRGVNLTLDRLANGQAGTVQLGAELQAELPGTNGVDRFRSRGEGRLEFTLRPDLLPDTFAATGSHVVQEATGPLGELANLTARLQARLTNGTLEPSTLKFTRRDQTLGEVRFSGPLNPATLEARLRLETTPLDRQVLDLLGAAFGIGFNQTRLTTHLDVELAAKGTKINVGARCVADPLDLNWSGQKLPIWTLQAGLNLSADLEAGSVRFTTLSLEGRQRGQRRLQGELQRPLLYSWKTGVVGPPDARFDLALTGLNLTEYRVWTPEALRSGTLDQSLQLGPDADHQSLQLSLEGSLRDFRWASATNQECTAAIAWSSQGTVTTAGHANLHLDLSLTDLALQDPTQKRSAPTNRLALRAAGDLRWRPERLDLTGLDLVLPPSTRSRTNTVRVTGHVDLPTNSAPAGQLELRAAALDLTPLYEAFAAMPASTNTAATPTPPAAPAPATEPEPLNLPVREFTLSAQCQQVFLREITLTNATAVVRVEPQRLALDPVRCAINHSPFSLRALLDGSQPGWAYELGIRADRIPLLPLANSFLPDSRDQYRGDLVADFTLRGAGLTPASYNRTLSGGGLLAFTNAQIQLFGPTAKRLLTPIATLLRINDINRSPVNWLYAHTTVSNGVVRLDPVALQSDAFEAWTRGSITLQDPPDRSPVKLPVDFYLNRTLAQKSNLLPSDAPADARFVKLPPFITVAGTLGEPKSDLDELKLGGVLLRSGLGVAEQLGVKVSPDAKSLLQGAGNLLTGTGSAPSATNQTAGASTNAPATNAPARLLDLLRRKP